QQSADDRIEGLKTGFDLLNQYPLTGCGPGAWRLATGRQTESHNLYGQVMGEMGTLGIVSFGALLTTLALALRQIRSIYKSHSEWWGHDFLYFLTSALALSL